MIGSHVARVRGSAAHAVALEMAGQRGSLWLDAGRGAAGIYLLARDDARGFDALAEGEFPGRTRQALLHFGKHLHGRRLTGLRRVRGERTIVLEAGSVALALRVSDPALTLAVSGTALATVGDGRPAWPPPADDPEREWDRLDPKRLREAIHAASTSGASPLRALLSICPPLGPVLGRRLVTDPAWLDELYERLRSPVPHLLAPAPLEECRDADLEPPGSVALVPIPLEQPGKWLWRADSWCAAAALYLRSRRRGDAFRRRRRVALDGARRDLRRLTQLAAHLERDLTRLPAADLLRRQGEALLATPSAVPPGALRAELVDPYDTNARLVVELDPRLRLPANADRLFERARRSERSRRQIAARLAETHAALDPAREREARVLQARDLTDFEAGSSRRAAARQAPAGGPRHYLTSRGLSLLVGRGAQENHRLTFAVARPEDLWLHARDVPGGHVILRDADGRAGSDDLREAAEVAAFFSEARQQPQVDVHVTRRKHVRPAGGGPGRVRVGHSETLRVAPRDPEGRLRRR